MSTEDTNSPSASASASSSPLQRTQFQGMLNVVRFNETMYQRAAILGVGFALLAFFCMQNTIEKWAFLLAAVTSFYFVASSLLAAHIAYDRSGLYELSWLRDILNGAVFGDNKKAVGLLNIHTGFDESTFYLQDFCRRMGATEVATTVVDLYDKQRTTEPSITIANKLYPVTYDPSVHLIRTGPEHWDVPDQSIDLAVLFLSAHELRRRNEKDALFAEIARVLKEDGRLVLLEHLRDGPNIAAFGLGAWHFFPIKEWFRASKSANLQILKEGTISAYIHVFCFKRGEGQ